MSTFRCGCPRPDTYGLAHVPTDQLIAFCLRFSVPVEDYVAESVARDRRCDACYARSGRRFWMGLAIVIALLVVAAAVRSS